MQIALYCRSIEKFSVGIYSTGFQGIVCSLSYRRDLSQEFIYQGGVIRVGELGLVEKGNTKSCYDIIRHICL